MPVGDWQFWVVTIVSLLGAWLIVRPFLPARRGRRKGTRVQLTVDRKRR